MRKNILVLDFRFYSPGGVAYISGLDIDNSELIRFVSLEDPEKRLILGAPFLEHGIDLRGKVFSVDFIVNRRITPYIEDWIFNSIEPVILLSNDILKKYNLEAILKSSVSKNGHLLSIGSYKIDNYIINDLDFSMEILVVENLSFYENNNGKCKATFRHKGKQYFDYSVPNHAVCSFDNGELKEIAYILISVDSEEHRLKDNITGEYKDNGYFKYVSVIKTLDKFDYKYNKGSDINHIKYGRVKVVEKNEDIVTLEDEAGKRIKIKKRVKKSPPKFDNDDIPF